MTADRRPRRVREMVNNSREPEPHGWAWKVADLVGGDRVLFGLGEFRGRPKWYFEHYDASQTGLMGPGLGAKLLRKGWVDANVEYLKGVR
jgi:hypothetical protein